MVSAISRKVQVGDLNQQRDHTRVEKKAEGQKYGRGKFFLPLHPNKIIKIIIDIFEKLLHDNCS
jgi:hypothetical protein